MAKADASDTIRELEAAIEWLRDHSVSKLDKVEKENPQIGENALLGHYVEEARAALDGLNPELVVSIATRSFLEIRRKRTGYDKDHAGGL